MSGGAGEWTGGRCWDMALALRDLTGLPLMGLFDDVGCCHHAFVWDESRKVGLDARGALPLDALRRGCRGQEMRPVSDGEVTGPGGWLGRELAPEEFDEAAAFARSHDVLAQEIEVAAARVAPGGRAP
jgi:hypothetical protein